MKKQAKRFWMVMQYACDRCGHEIDFYLEDGCEGPRDRQAPVPPQWEYMRKRAPAIIRATMPDTVSQTASGRYVLSVPFIAGACRECQPGGPPYSLSGGVMQHANWGNDRTVDTTEPPADAGRFLYPADWWADQACGDPVFPAATTTRDERMSTEEVYALAEKIQDEARDAAKQENARLRGALEKIVGRTFAGPADPPLPPTALFHPEPRWIPTPENINALPEPVSRYIHDLETRADPAGEVRELTICRDTVRALLAALASSEDPGWHAERRHPHGRLATLRGPRRTDRQGPARLME